MPETAKKFHIFVAGPMGKKAVTVLPGISETLGARLVKIGFEKAITVYGQYLILKKDEILFKEWLKDSCGASGEEASACYDCLNEWSEKFL